MRANIEDYYRLFNDWDAGRIAQYDKIMSDPDPDFDIIKTRLAKWYNEAITFPGLGDKGAKVLAFAMLKTVFIMKESEQRQAMAIGRMVNAAAPIEWRVK